MTEDNLYDHLRYFLDLHAKSRDDTKDPGSEVLYDMSPISFDRLHACLWVAPGVSVDTRRKVATALLASAIHVSVPDADCKSRYTMPLITPV